MVAFSAPVFALPPKRRLRTKTTPKKVHQEPLQCAPILLLQEEPQLGNRCVYFVTLAHPRQQFSACGVRLRAPEDFPKAKILDFILNVCREPTYADARNIKYVSASVKVKYLSVWRELHKEDADGQLHAHDHLALVGMRSFRFLPVKRALLQKYGLASHWSCTHDGYHSAVRYVFLPSDKKPLAALDRQPLLWAAPGLRHPAPDECCEEPCTAEALQARRRRACDKALEKGKPEPRVSDIDVWPLVVRAGLRNTDDDHNAHKKLMAYAKSHASKAMVTFLFKNRSRLTTLINDIWEWECVEENLAVAGRTRCEALTAARAAACACGGRWLAFVEKSWELNRLPADEVCFHVLRSLFLGRGENVPVVVFAGRTGGEGKSFFFSALQFLFADGEVFCVPEKANFPFLGIENAKAVFLDDWRFGSTAVGLPTQLLWLEGKPVAAAKPQNTPGVSGNFIYKGSAPIFITTSLPHLVQLRKLAETNPLTGLPHDANAAMLLRRLRVYDFTVVTPKPAGPRVPFCARCFANMVVGRGSSYAQAHGVSYQM